MMGRAGGWAGGRAGKGFVYSMSAGFVFDGMFGSFFGPLAVLIMEHYKITPIEYSWLTTLIYISGLGAPLFIVFFGDRVNKIWLLCASTSSLTLVLFLFSLALPFRGMLLVGAVAGFMFILIDVTVNAIVLEAFSERKNTLIPVLYSVYDSGTVFGPFFVTLLVTPALAATFVKPYYVLGFAGCVILAFLIFSAKKIMPYTPYAHLRKKTVTYGLAVFKSKKAWLIMLAGISMFFVYSGVIVWMPTFANLEIGASFQASGLSVTLFFVAAIVSKAFGPLIYKRFSPQKCVFLFGFALALCTCMIVFCSNIAALFLLVVLSGACCGMAVPSVVLFASDMFPEHPSVIAAISIMEFSIGGSVAPVLMSLVAKDNGFGVAFMVTGILCAAGIAILGVGLAREKYRR